MFILDISCGDGVSIPQQLAHIVAMIINFIYIGVPILLIVWGMLDLGKATISQKEDEIKKHQKMFFKRLLSAVLVFFIAVAVEFVLGILAKADLPGMYGVSECVDKLIDY